jgi:hypothetical protein
MERLLIPVHLPEQAMAVAVVALVEQQFLVTHLEMVELPLLQASAGLLPIMQVAAVVVDLLQQLLAD